MIDNIDLMFKSNTFIDIKNGKLGGIAIVEKNGANIPVELKTTDLTILYKYPNVIEKLQEGATLYIKNGKAYIGNKYYEGPYNEQGVFETKYISQGYSMEYLADDLDNNIKENKIIIKKLMKVGESYEQ